MDNVSIEERMVEVDPLSLLPNPFQVRQPGDESDLRFDELGESIGKTGLIELPVLRETDKGYQIGAGHRRVAACIKLGFKTIRCIVRSLTDEQMAETILEENLKRNSLNPIEEARGYANFRCFHRSEEWIATRFNVTRDVVAQRLRLLTFPEPIQTLVARGQLTPSHAEAICMAPANSRVNLARIVLEKGLNVKETAEEAKRLLEEIELNEQALQNIGRTTVSFQQRLIDVERRIQNAESSLRWFDLFSAPWKCEQCSYNISGFCHRFHWAERPTYWIQRLRKIAKFKRFEGNWLIQTSQIVCAHCTLFKEREGVPAARSVT